MKRPILKIIKRILNTDQKMLYIVRKPRKNVQTKSFLFVRTSCLRFVCAENQIAEVFNLTKSPKKSKEVDAARIKWRDSEVLGLEQRSSWRGTDETGAAQIKWRDSEVLVPAPRSSWRGTDTFDAVWHLRSLYAFFLGFVYFWIWLQCSMKLQLDRVTYSLSEIIVM